LDRPPYEFKKAHRQKIEERAARRSSRPLAEPFEGALAVGFFAAMVGTLFLGFGGDIYLSDHRREGIAMLVSFLAGGIAYFVLRSQHRAFAAAVEREARELWWGHEGDAYRDVATL
jgi:hypothetical protein